MQDLCTRLAELVDIGQGLKPDPLANDFPFRGSAVGGCPRAPMMLGLGAPRLDVDARRKRGFEVGHQREAALGEALRLGLAAAGDPDWNLDEQYTVWLPLPDLKGDLAEKVVFAARAWSDKSDGRCTLRYNLLTRCAEVACTIDALLSKPQDTAIIIDWKTKHSFGIKMLKTEGVDDGYSSQVAGYAEALSPLFPNGVRSVVFYENKDNQDHVPLEVDLEEYRPRFESNRRNFTEALVHWYDASPEAIETPFEPNAKAELPWQCNYCSVGPKAGRCYEHMTLRNAAQAGAVPKWIAVPKTLTDQAPY